MNRLSKLKALSLILAFVLVSSMAFAAPASKGSKSRKSSTQKKQKASSKKSSSRKVAKTRSSRSNKKVARKSRKGGRSVARRGGRRSKPRWRAQDASASLAYRSSNIQNFLTGSWANTTTAAQRQTLEPGATQSLTPLSSAPILQPQPAAATIPANPPGTDGTPATGEEQAITNPIPINPLVLAYEESLAARGFEAENQGFIVSTMAGEILAEHNADRQFNPASVIKVATSLTAISRLGPDFRYRTSLYTDGTFDPSTGTLNGSLYVIGSGDPAFFYENVMLIADKLNRTGIRAIEGDLVVLGPFYFNFSASRETSAKAFRICLTNDKWTAASRRAYSGFLAMRAAEERNGAKQQGSPSYYSAGSSQPPSLKISGKTVTDATVSTSGLRPLAVHTSLPLVRMLKGLNDFSNNWMAHVIGNLVGGPDAVQRFLENEVGLKGEELNIVTSSGLGSNHISPRATIQLLRKLIIYLNNRGMQIEEILPVAGVDAGTLQRRFTDAYRGSVVAKTGTLSSVSALAGVAYTRGRGPLLFVIYNRGGSTYSFRAVQDETIKKMITLFGGPAPVRYIPTSEPSISSNGTQTERQSIQR